MQSHLNRQQQRTKQNNAKKRAQASVLTRGQKNKTNKKQKKLLDTSHSHEAKIVVARRNAGVLFTQHLDLDDQCLVSKLNCLVMLALL